MDRMKNLGLPGLAAKYKDLCNKVMEHERSRYVPIFRAPPPAASTPMPMPMPTSSSLGFSDTNLAMDSDSQDDEFFSTFGVDEPADLVLEDGYLQFE
jgi:hypothetical protein